MLDFKPFFLNMIEEYKMICFEPEESNQIELVCHTTRDSSILSGVNTCPILYKQNSTLIKLGSNK